MSSNIVILWVHCTLVWGIIRLGAGCGGCVFQWCEICCLLVKNVMRFEGGEKCGQREERGLKLNEL